MEPFERTGLSSSSLEIIGRAVVPVSDDLLDYEIFNPLDRQDLDIIYLGMEVDVPLWEVFLLAAPPMSEMLGLTQTDATRDMMRMSANYGMILTIGGHTYEEVLDENKKRAPCPYRTGQWVAFEEFHPQSRKYNGVMTYCISDSRVMKSIKELDMWDCYLLFEENLKKIRDHAAAWRSMSRRERKLNAGRELCYD